MDAVIEVAVAAARAGGAVALRAWGRRPDVSLKMDRSPVTEADRDAEEAIRATLADAFPGWGVLGEESGATGNAEVRWIVDPIDGTRNFVRGIPFWGTLIALEEHGEVTAGVIFSPVTGDLHVARRGLGAYRNGERVRVSAVEDLAEALLIHATLRPLRSTRWWPAFTALVDATDRQRGWGDYLGFTAVAEGKAELYAEIDVKPWDVAPCKILVEEAGGRFTDLRGRPTIYGGSALAGNGRLHAAALAIVEAHASEISDDALTAEGGTRS